MADWFESGKLLLAPGYPDQDTAVQVEGLCGDDKRALKKALAFVAAAEGSEMPTLVMDGSQGDIARHHVFCIIS